MTGTERKRRFEELVRRHRGEVYRAVLRGTGSREEAEDITQTAMLHAYRAWERGDLPEHPRAWMFAIAENARRGVYRRSRRRPEEVELPDEVVDDRSTDAPLARELLDAVGTLPERQRAVLVLREVAGLSYTEIAERLGESVGAVQMLLFRARRALRAELQPQRRVLERLAFLPPGWLHVLQPGGGGPVAARAAGGVGALAVGLLVAGSVPTGEAAPRDAQRPAAALVTTAGPPQADRPAARTIAAGGAAPRAAAPLHAAKPAAERPAAAGGAGAAPTDAPAGAPRDGAAQPVVADRPDPPRREPAAPVAAAPAPRVDPSAPPAVPPALAETVAAVTAIVGDVTDAVEDVADAVEDVVTTVPVPEPPPLPPVSSVVPELPAAEPPLPPAGSLPLPGG